MASTTAPVVKAAVPKKAPSVDAAAASDSTEESGDPRVAMGLKAPRGKGRAYPFQFTFTHHNP